MSPSWENNAYYNPENLGLELVAEFELSEPNYSFDTFIVLREKETGKVYVAHDAGCSCPTPFEGFTFPQDFTEVRSYADVKREYDSHLWREQGYEPLSNKRQRIVGAFRRGS